MNKRIFYTIKELYDWAKENGYENYDCFITDEGCLTNIWIDDIDIREDKKEICL